MDNLPPDKINTPEIQTSKGQIVADFRGKKPILPKELGYGVANYIPRKLVAGLEGMDLVIIPPEGKGPAIIHLAKNIDDEVARTKILPGNSRQNTKLILMQSYVDKADEEFRGRGRW